MITLDKNQRDIQIPDYNDLDNKPRINGVELSGDKSAEELGIVFDTKNYYTKSQSDNKFQPKGNYLTEIPSEYVTESELNDALKDIKIDASVDLTGYATESWVSDNYQTKGNYLTEIPSEYITESELQRNNYASKSEIPVVPTTISSFTNDSGYITNSALSDYATETWVGNHYQPKGSYLTSVPSEYVTESELNDAIAGLGGGDVPYVVIEYKNAMTLTPISGDLQATLNAAKNKQPFLAYFYNTYATYGKQRTLYPFTYVTVEASGFSLQYHTEIGSVHKDIVINGSYDTTTGEYSLDNTLGQASHSYATTTQLNSKQDTLVSGTNIKTINGESILGSGNIIIEGGSGGSTDLTGYATEDWVSANYQTKGNYATTSYVNEKIGDINTILENIIG